MFGIVAAQDAMPHFQFDGTTFKGDIIGGLQSSVFQYQNISNGKTFRWLREDSQAGTEVIRVDLMYTNNDTNYESILFWCNDPQTCGTTEGFNGSSLHA